MICELCGKEVDTATRVRIERSVLSVCSSCAKFGSPLDPPPPDAPTPATSAGRSRPTAGATRGPTGPRRLEERDLYQEIGELELAPDWGHRVRIAREALAWTPEELAKKLNEKKSVVLKVEVGELHPPDELVRKLERLLKVRLRADPETAPG